MYHTEEKKDHRERDQTHRRLQCISTPLPPCLAQTVSEQSSKRVHILIQGLECLLPS